MHLLLLDKQSISISLKKKHVFICILSLCLFVVVDLAIFFFFFSSCLVTNELITNTPRVIRTRFRYNFIYLSDTPSINTLFLSQICFLFSSPIFNSSSLL